jgi:hypothetical protein
MSPSAGLPATPPTAPAPPASVPRWASSSSGRSSHGSGGTGHGCRGRQAAASASRNRGKGTRGVLPRSGSVELREGLLQQPLVCALMHPGRSVQLEVHAIALAELIHFPFEPSPPRHALGFIGEPSADSASHPMVFVVDRQGDGLQSMIFQKSLLNRTDKNFRELDGDRTPYTQNPPNLAPLRVRPPPPAPKH